jgi:hypothetical protein
MILGLAAAAVLWLTIPPDSVPINLRWRAGITAEARASLERRFALVDGELVGEDTWRYRLREYSPEQVRALVTDEAVADTHYIDRSTFRPEDPPINRIVFVVAGSLLSAILGAFALSGAPLTLGPRGVTLAVAGAPLVLFLLGILILTTTGVTGEWPWAGW